MPIPVLPLAPSTASPTTFAADMDAFLAALPAWGAAINAAGSLFGISLSGTSATSLVIGTGAKSLTVQTGLSFAPGMALIVAATASPVNRMVCTVTSYDAGTGALVVNADGASGAGTFAAWSVMPTAVANFDGQTYTDLRLAGKITETIYALAGNVLAPGNGSIQTKTLAANVTMTETLADGNSLVLQIAAGAFTVVWPTTTWLWGMAPILSTTGRNILVFWKVGGVLYGVNAGTA